MQVEDQRAHQHGNDQQDEREQRHTSIIRLEQASLLRVRPDLRVPPDAMETLFELLTRPEVVALAAMGADVVQAATGRDPLKDPAAHQCLAA